MSKNIKPNCKWRQIDKDILEDLYLVQNKCYREIADILHTDYYTVRNASKEYGLNKKYPKSELRKSSSKNGTLYKHGVENVFQLESVKKKIKQTTLERYKVTHTSKLKSNREKAKQTTYERFGDYNNAEKGKQTMLKKYGVAYPVLLPSCQTTKNSYSKINNEVASFLEGNNIDYEREYSLSYFKYDFKIGDFLVELNPFATHNSTWGPYHNPKPKDYHLKKSNFARSKGFKCVHIWDWDDYKEIIFAIVDNRLNIETLDGPQLHIYNYATKEHKIITDPEHILLDHEVLIYDSGETYIINI